MKKSLARSLNHKYTIELADVESTHREVEPDEPFQINTMPETSTTLSRIAAASHQAPMMR